MRILFMCGALEPGRDGVGDYTRRLAGALITSGFEASIVAVSDSYTSEIISGSQKEDATIISILRLPAELSFADKTAAVRSYINTQRPELISLQYVPYAFHPKGLPYRWIHFFKSIKAHSPWHVMMHELWIGAMPEDSFKTKLIGFAQKQIIAATLRAVNPFSISTSIPFYQQKLSELGFSAAVQPVFSNLPKGNRNNTAVFDTLPTQIKNNRSAYCLATFFGTIHPVSDLPDKLQQLQQKIVLEGREMVLLHIGRSYGVQHLFKSLQERLGVVCKVLGEYSAEEIADFFTQVDVGLSTYGGLFLGKSGSVAAMLNNQLPVILLHYYPNDKAETLPYVRYIDEIEKIAPFMQQENTFSEQYSIERAVSFYQQLPTNGQ